MISFSYRAFDSHSNIQAGTIAAATEEAAIDALYDRGLTPFETRTAAALLGDANHTPTQRALSKSPSGRAGQLSLKELSTFTAELESLVNSGVALDDALRVIEGTGSTRAIASISSHVLKDMLGGAQLSEALAKRDDIFPADYRAIVRAGEAAGTVGPALQQISGLLARRVEIRGKITSAMIYPAVLFAMAILSIGMIVVFLLPSLVPIFEDANRPLPSVLALLLQMQENWVVFLASLAAVGLCSVSLFRLVSRMPAVLTVWDKIKVSTPVIGELIRMREAARFMRALGTLLTSGVSLVPSLGTARNLISNRFLAGQYDAAIGRVPEGIAVHSALQPYGLIPASGLRLVAIGEETGQLGKMLIRAASLIEADHLRRVERMLGLLTPAITLIIGGGVGSLIMVVMSAVMSINELAIQ